MSKHEQSGVGISVYDCVAESGGRPLAGTDDSVLGGVAEHRSGPRVCSGPMAEQDAGGWFDYRCVLGPHLYEIDAQTIEMVKSVVVEIDRQLVWANRHGSLTDVRVMLQVPDSRTIELTLSARSTGR
jgi:hypothetical protein